MFEAIKKVSKKVKVALVGAAVVALSAVATFAEGASGTANSAVTSAMTTVKDDMLATGNAIIPIALAVVGLSIVVIFGVRMVRKIAK